MAYITIELVLAGNVADNGTVTGIAYPAGTNQAFFTNDNASATGVAVINNNEVYRQLDTKIDITYGGTITLTNKSGTGWTAGSAVILSLAHATADVVTVIAQPAEPDLALTALDTGDAYTDDDVNGVFDDVQAKVNAILAKLVAAGVLSAT